MTIINRLFPQHTKRRLALRLCKQFMLHPKYYIKYFNIGNVLKFIKRDIATLERFYQSVYHNKSLLRKSDFEVPLTIFEERHNYTKIIFERQATPKISIIIPVHNQWAYTYNCLKSILANAEGVSYEIIIVDDLSTDETVNIGQYIENITVIRNETNLGFLRNCNNAAKVAKGQYLHFLNNDTNVQEYWLLSLVTLLERDPSIGLVGSKLVYPNGMLQEAGGIIWNDASGWNYGRLQDPASPEYNYVKEVDYISGASILIAKKLWDTIGGFDERYIPAYFEDSDLAFEVRKQGLKVVYQPASVVVHFEGISHGTDVTSGVKAYQIDNKVKFVDKWKKELATQFPSGQYVFHARDRSKHKKTIVIVDHYVPTFDKDAGSRTTFQYINLFIEKGFNVKFIGDNFYYYSVYTNTLEQLGVEVLYGAYYKNNWQQWIKENKHTIHYFFLNRPHIAENYIDFIKHNTTAKIIYYGHDLHFMRLKREYELTNNIDVLIDSEKFKAQELDIILKSDMSYYPSEIEVKTIQEISPIAKIKAIPAYIYDKPADYMHTDSQQRKDLLFVGGFSHAPNLDGVNWFISNVLPLIQEKNSLIKLIVVGSNAPDELKNLRHDSICVKGFVSDEVLSNLYQTAKIAIVPLRYGAGVKGKLVEALYHAVPVVTTSVGAEGLDGIDKVVAIADMPEVFAQHILNLYNDDVELNKMAVKNSKYVEKYFSKQYAWDVIKDDFS